MRVGKHGFAGKVVEGECEISSSKKFLYGRVVKQRKGNMMRLKNIVVIKSEKIRPSGKDLVVLKGWSVKDE